ncbi:MAG TPA: lytic transglycosylase domain-containing protein [Vicinamibacterales bacterium]|nr:lytic transglycosylase domain-containing protein [Vicinamibacterales bacterium]
MSSSLLRIIALAALCTTVPAVAQAQIYSWRDSSGTLVLSDTPKDAAATTFAVPGVRAAGIRTTKKVVSKRAAEFEPLILQHATAYGVRPDLIRGVIQAESAFNPMARSPKGAMGLMQLMPGTAAVYGVHNAYDPAQNIRAGVAYLSSLLGKYAQNEELALAAYNAGPGAVKKYGRVPPYRETRDYIARIQGNVGTGIWPAVNRAVYSAVEVLSGRQVTRLTNVPSPKSSAVRAGIN